MRKSMKLSFLVSIILLNGCAGTIPPPMPQDTLNSLAIGISVKERAILRFVKSKAETVYFVRMEEGEDLLSQTQLIRSTYAKDGQVYLLNAKPGRYAVVASERIVADSGTYTTFFSKELIEQTQVTVAAGEMAFMGQYEIDTSQGMEDKADSAQDHFYRYLKAGKIRSSGVLGLAVHGQAYYRGTIHEAKRDEVAETNFLSKAKKHFAEVPGWLDLIDRKLAKISSK